MTSELLRLVKPKESSFGESNYASSQEPEVLPFNLDVVRNSEFKIDEMQKRILVFKREDDLYDCLPTREKMINESSPTM